MGEVAHHSSTVRTTETNPNNIALFGLRRDGLHSDPSQLGPLNLLFMSLPLLLLLAHSNQLFSGLQFTIGLILCCDFRVYGEWPIGLLLILIFRVRQGDFVMHDQHVSAVKFPNLPVTPHLLHSLIIGRLQNLRSYIHQLLLQKSSHDDYLLAGIHAAQDYLGSVDIPAQNSQLTITYGASCEVEQHSNGFGNGWRIKDPNKGRIDDCF